MHGFEMLDEEDLSWTIHHNGDFSGGVLITRNARGAHEEERMAIPFEVLEEIVGRKFHADAVRRLEDVSGSEFLAVQCGHDRR